MQKIVKFCQKNGIKRFKTADFEIEFLSDFSPKPKPLRSGQERPIVVLGSEEGERMPTDDEMLLWSSPAYDVLREQRKA